MEQNHILTVTGYQMTDGQEEKIEQSYPCTYSQVGKKFFLVYHELTPEKVLLQVTVKATPQKIIISKSGKLSSHMELADGITTVCDYPTIFGKIPLEIETQSIRFALTEKGGELFAAYHLMQNGQLLSQNRISMRVTEK